jgi:transposase
MTAQIAKPRHRTPKRQIKTEERSIATMKAAGMSERDIAKAKNLPKTTVHQIIHRVYSQEEVQAFKTNEAVILDNKRLMLMDALDQEAIKEMCPRDRVTSYGILYDKMRIERGHSSEGKPLVIINKIIIGSNTNITDITPESPKLTE